MISAALGVSASGCGLLLGLDGYTAATCDDGVRDGNETDVDCGGPCARCVTDRACRIAEDCESGRCVAGLCPAPACDDGVKNGFESDTDCGEACSPCADGMRCGLGPDCVSEVCSGDICRAPVCDDGVSNGVETDVDCGGGECALCENGRSCGVGVDCISGGCPKGTCGPWAMALGGAQDDFGVAVAVDTTGDLVVAGMFSATMTIGAQELVSAGGQDIFVARLAPDGVPRWSKRFGGPGDDTVADMALDAKGDAVLVGTGTDVDFGGGVVGVAGKRAIFTVKLFRGAGEHVWSKGYEASLATAPSGVAVDANGDVLFCGTYDSAGLTLNVTLSNSGGLDGFYAKASGVNGKLMWSGKIGGTGDDYLVDIAAAPESSFVIALTFASPTVVLGSETHQNAGSGGELDMLLARLSTGEFLPPIWSKRYGIGETEALRGVTVSGDGDILATGLVDGVFNIGGGMLGSNRSDVFIAKYAGADGSHKWSRSFGGDWHDYGWAVAVTNEGDPVLVGTFTSDSVDFGGGSLQNPGALSPDVFVAKYAGADGAHLASLAFGSGLADAVGGVALNPVTGNVIVGGAFNSAMELPSGPLASGGKIDSFVVSFGSDL
jgi:hypothetical protein